MRLAELLVPLVPRIGRHDVAGTVDLVLSFAQVLHVNGQSTDETVAAAGGSATSGSARQHHTSLGRVALQAETGRRPVSIARPIQPVLTWMCGLRHAGRGRARR